MATMKLPSHSNLTCEFIYNFFTKDEATNEGPSPAFRDISNESMIRLLPRYNRLTFSLPNIEGISIKKEDKNKIYSNIQSIYSCEDVGNSSNTTLTTQDIELSNSIYQMLMRSANIRKITGNMSDISMGLAASIDNLSQKDIELLQSLSNSYSNSGASFLKDTKTLIDIKFENFKTANSTVTINDKFLDDLLKSAERNNWLGNSTSHGLLKARANLIQSAARRNPYIITDSDYDTVLVPVDFTDASSSTPPTIKFIGTLVYRQEMSPSGIIDSNSTKLLDILSPDATKYNDYNIKLDTKYFYWLHALYEINLNTILLDDAKVLTSNLYFQSLPSDSTFSYTKDRTPPQPPVQFDISWDYQFYNIVLHWNFPVCKTRDIKYFQIYRRASINEPFELIQEYDFNDSSKKPSRVDGILQSKIKKVEIPLKYYVDKSFNKKSKYIYAITCMDARGLISNYSCQIHVSFDEIKNKLIKKVISKSNAPIQYPNIFLERDFFLDTIKVSKKNKISIFFDPEYLKLKKSNGSIIDGVLTSEVGSYSVNIFDINRAEFVSVPININDLQKK
jgi:hypothetical protein